MAAGQKKPEIQWTPEERKAANLDQRLKSLIMSMLPDDQMNYVINFLTAKSTWDDLILYHEGPFVVKENKDFQDSLDDEEDTRSSQEYINDLKEEYKAKALLVKSKRFFKKGAQRFSSAKATNQTECHKCSKKGHFARDYWSKTSVPLYQLPFQPKLLHSFEHKPKPMHTKYFEAKYNKVKAKLALLEVSSDDNEVTKVKALMALANEEKCQQCNKPKLSGDEDFTLSNHDTSKHPLPPLEKLTCAELVSRPKTIKSILKSKSTFKAKTLKGITINEPSLASARGNKSSLASKTNSALAGKLKNVKIEDDPPLAIVMKELNELKLQFSKNKSSYFKNKNSQHVSPNALQNKYKSQFKMNCKLCGQNNHLSENCYELLFCKKCKRTNHRTCDHAEFMSSMNINQYHTSQEESNLETLNMSQRTMKHVVAMFIPHQITMTLSGSGKENFFKLRKLSHSKQSEVTEQSHMSHSWIFMSTCDFVALRDEHDTSMVPNPYRIGGTNFFPSIKKGYRYRTEQDLGIRTGIGTQYQEIDTDTVLLGIQYRFGTKLVRFRFGTGIRVYMLIPSPPRWKIDDNDDYNNQFNIT
nr:hypothetical protein [Tanacetum cinerariifolium]